MAGNVEEWVLDWYQNNFYISSPEKNPMGPESGKYRVRRGGSWGNFSLYLLRVAARGRSNPDDSRSYIGFRCAHSP